VDRARWPESMLGLAMEQEFFTPLFASYLFNVERVRVAPTLNGKAVIRIEPALTITWRQCEQLLSALDRALAMFTSGDSGRIIASILDGRARPVVPVVDRPRPWLGVTPKPGQRRFAFLMHPLEDRSALDFDPSLGHLFSESLAEVMRSFSSLA